MFFFRKYKISLFYPGSPRSGKSFFMKRLLSNISQMRPNANYISVLYCNPNLKSLSAKDKKFTDELKHACGEIPIQFLSDLPTTEKMMSLKTGEDARSFIIIDDFQESSLKSKPIQELFGRLGTHFYLDCALLLQFAFSRAQHYAHIVQAASCIVMFKSPSDRTMMRNVNTKMFPKAKQYLQKAMRRASEKLGTYPYVVINCDPGNILSELFPLSCHIFPDSKGEINATYWAYEPEN